MSQIQSTPTGTDGRVLRASARRAHRREAILDSAKRVFSDKGYHGTRISDIIAAAGVARGTFYLYFESKSAIFLELLNALLDEFRAGVVGVDMEEEAPPVYLQLLGTVRQLLQTAAVNAALAPIIFREAVGLDEVVEAKLEEFYNQLHGYIFESLVNGQEMGLLRELDTEIAATCVLGSIRQVLYRELVQKSGQEFDVDRCARAILQYNCIGLMKTRVTV